MGVEDEKAMVVAEQQQVVADNGSGSGGAPAQPSMTLPAPDVTYNERLTLMMMVARGAFVDATRALVDTARRRQLDVSGGKKDLSMEAHVRGMLRGEPNIDDMQWPNAADAASVSTISTFYRDPPPSLMISVTASDTFFGKMVDGKYTSKPSAAISEGYVATAGTWSFNFIGDLSAQCTEVADTIEAYFFSTPQYSNSPQHMMLRVILHYLEKVSQLGRKDPSSAYMVILCLNFIDALLTKRPEQFAMDIPSTLSGQGRVFMTVLTQVRPLLNDILQEINHTAWKLRAVDLMASIKSDLDNGRRFLFKGLASVLSSTNQSKLPGMDLMAKVNVSQPGSQETGTSLTSMEKVAVFFAKKMFRRDPALAKFEEDAEATFLASLAPNTTAVQGAVSGRAESHIASWVASDGSTHGHSEVGSEMLTSMFEPAQQTAPNVDDALFADTLALGTFYKDIVGATRTPAVDSAGVESAILLNEPTLLLVKDCLGLFYILSLLSESYQQVEIMEENFKLLGELHYLLQEAQELSKLLGGLEPITKSLITNVESFLSKIERFHSERVGTPNARVDESWRANYLRAVKFLQKGVNHLRSVLSHVDNLRTLATSVQNNPATYMAGVAGKLVRAKAAGDFTNAKLAKIAGKGSEALAYTTQTFAKQLEKPETARAAFILWAQMFGVQGAIERARSEIQPAVLREMQLLDMSSAVTDSSAARVQLLPAWAQEAMANDGRVSGSTLPAIDRAGVQQRLQAEADGLRVVNNADVRAGLAAAGQKATKKLTGGGHSF